MTKHESIPYIEHIRDAINDIESFTKNSSKEDFLKSRLIQSAVIRQIGIIGEAAKNVSEVFKKKYLEVEWKKMTGTRDKVIHAYFEVNLDILWEIIKNNLPSLKKQILEILKKERQKQD